MNENCSYNNECAANADESQQTYQGAAEQKSNTSNRKRKPRRNKSIHINERPLKKAHNNSMSSLIIQINRSII